MPLRVNGPGLLLSATSQAVPGAGRERCSIPIGVIDSVAAWTGGIDFGIGPMGSCMRLIQSCSKFNVTVLWLHHTKPGAAKADMGIDGAVELQHHQVPLRCISTRCTEGSR